MHLRLTIASKNLYKDHLAPFPGLHPGLHHLQYKVAWERRHRSPTKWS